MYIQATHNNVDKAGVFAIKLIAVTKMKELDIKY